MSDRDGVRGGRGEEGVQVKCSRRLVARVCVTRWVASAVPSNKRSPICSQMPQLSVGWLCRAAGAAGGMTWRDEMHLKPAVGQGGRFPKTTCWV